MTALAALSPTLGNTHDTPARVVSVPAFVTPPGDATRNDFMRKVHDAQVQRALDRGREFFPGLPEDQLGAVESGYKMRRDAAGQCRLLLEQARSDLKRQQEEGIREALEVSDIGVFSAYRSFERDRAAWLNAFEKHFKATKNERAGLEGGEYGDQAVELMVNVMRKFKAAPGFSRHTSGVAVDFRTTEGNVTLDADSDQNERWKKSWLYKWLVKNAKKFKFKPLATEAWHWDYEG
ncbi:MAG: D-alanyl-D-alanine carboxypeptidase family protein [Pyrinomonadaceae bacterium]